MKPYILILIAIHISLSSFGQEKGHFTDGRDGHIYKWIKIGNQIWMAENLAYLPEISKLSLSLKIASTAPKYFVYGYQGSDVKEAKKEKNYIKRGTLYNWVAAKGACPKGWHLPSDREWKILEKKLGMPEDQIDEWFYREGGNIGLTLKSKSGWSDNGNGLDQFGFSVIPSGFRHRGHPKNPKNSFSFDGDQAFFWSSTPYKPKSAFRRHFSSLSKGIDRYPGSIPSGYCVRCIKNSLP